jgi:hypothetical protein
MSYKIESSVGKVTIVTVLFGIAIIALGFFTDSRHFGRFQIAMATTTVSTSVTVLNTPPIWNGSTAEESPASFGTTPTNSGSAVTWVTTAKDNNGEDYFLLICKDDAGATPHNNAKPTCVGGESVQWGVSATTTSETQASVATTTQESFTESNAWWGWICDSNAGNARCNVTSSQGTGDSASPFIVNHRPTFTVYADDSPADPGATVTWTSTADDTDVNPTDDTVALFVCKTNVFTSHTCEGGQQLCTSGAVASNPSCQAVMESIKQDQTYPAYGFVTDNHNHDASGGQQAVNSVIAIRNVDPSISASSISLLNTDDDPNALILTTAHGQTTGFKTVFTVTDNNSCIATSTANEIASATLNVYRSSVAMAGCDTSGEFNANQCYTDTVATGMWQPSCTQDGGSCSGAADNAVTWTCTFPLWYNADPTWTGTFYDTDKWNASVQAYDKYGLLSTATSTDDIAAGSRPYLQMLLAYDVPITAIAYDALEPGFDTVAVNESTTIAAWGNVGMDEVLYGEDMCTAADRPGCDAGPTRTVASTNQEFSATSGFTWGTGVDLLESALGQTLILDVNKTTSTSTPESKNTYWGIGIPGAITLAGNYVGQNYVAGKVSDPATW